MKSHQVIIIGTGLAGLFLADKLADEQIDVVLVDRKHDLTKSVHTTGIFVRKTFEDFDFPADTLGPAISGVSVYSPALKKIDLESELPEFRVGKMGLLYKTFLDRCISKGVTFLNGTRYIGSSPDNDANSTDSIVTLEKNGEQSTFRTHVLVGGDGAASRVAADLGLDQNREWIVGYEEVFKSHSNFGEPRLHCFFDNELAPGYLAWISNDGEEVHIGVGGYPSRFDPREALRVFKRTKVQSIIDINGAVPLESRGGRIPVGGVLKRISNERGLLIGDAAGAVSPLTAGGLDPCLRLSEFAARLLKERIETGKSECLLGYSGSMFRTKFRSRLFLRYAIKAANSNFLLENGFRFFKTSQGLRFAEKIFFRRESFPDIDPAERKRFHGDVHQFPQR